MKLKQKPYFLPVLVSTGSFLCLMAVALLTSPLKDIAYTALFFVILFIFLVSFGYSLSYIRRGAPPKSKNRSRIIIISVFIVIALMFRSAQSLNLIDVLILILVVIGLLFYSSKRLP